MGKTTSKTRANSRAEGPTIINGLMYVRREHGDIFWDIAEEQ